MSRKRKDLLLYLVMGAPQSSLYVQSVLISLFIITPSILTGLLIGHLIPKYLNPTNQLIELPVELIEAIQVSHPPVESVAFIAFASVLIATVMSLTSVQSVTQTNPSSVFRGE